MRGFDACFGTAFSQLSRSAIPERTGYDRALDTSFSRFQPGAGLPIVSLGPKATGGRKMFDISMIPADDGSVTLGLSGELRDDDSRLKLIQYVTRNCIEDGPGMILLRFDHLAHVDLETTLTLHGLVEEARMRGKTLRVAGVNGDTRRKLKGLGILA